MMKKRFVNQLNNKKFEMKNKSLKENCLLIKLKKLKKIYLIVKTDFKDNSKI